MNYLIIENEPLAFELLNSMIHNLRPEWNLVYTCGTVSDAVKYFGNGGDADLCFFDIELNDGDCFEIFNEVDINLPVIFTTAYHEYALRAFRVNSIDYLLKPVSISDLEGALNLFEKHNGTISDLTPKVERNNLYRKIKDSVSDGGQQSTQISCSTQIEKKESTVFQSILHLFKFVLTRIR